MPELVHPDLPGRSITVPERAVRLHERAGWERVADAIGALASTGESAGNAAAALAGTVRSLTKPSPAEPVKPEPVDIDPLDLEKE